MMYEAKHALLSALTETLKPLRETQVGACVTEAFAPFPLVAETWHVTLLGIIAAQIVYMIARRALPVPRALMQKQSLDARTATGDVGNGVVAVLHALVVGVGAALVKYYPAEEVRAWTPANAFVTDAELLPLVATSLAYFIWDTLWMCTHRHVDNMRVWMAHHIAALMCFSALMVPFGHRPFGVGGLMMELSGPFMNGLIQLENYGHGEVHPGAGNEHVEPSAMGKAVYLFTQLCFVITFMYARIFAWLPPLFTGLRDVALPWLHALFVEHNHEVLKHLPVSIGTAQWASLALYLPTLFLTALQIFWAGQIVIAILRVVGVLPSPAKPEKNDDKRD
ncbi:MAG: hypothetical protein MHM6MM_002645 [Cercozoa sp. M6MM]